MEKILRKIFNDPEFPINKPPEPHSRADELSAEREEILLELKERLSPEDLEVLERYVNKSFEMQGEYEYIAFCGGIRYFALLFAEIIAGC